MDAVQQGHCIFLTGVWMCHVNKLGRCSGHNDTPSAAAAAGGAGVGKSFAVDALVQALQARGLVVAKTASTGTAALNINGMTVHR